MELIALHTDTEGDELKPCCSCVALRAGVHHCATCDACIAGPDHHCRFLGTCIGKGNRRVFVAFLLAACVSCSSAAALYLTDDRGLCAAAPTRLMTLASQRCLFSSDPLRFHALWSNVCVAVFTAFLCTGQLVHVGAETTTYEAIRGRGSRALFHPHGALKSVENVAVFLWTGRFKVTPLASACCDRRDHCRRADADHV